MTELPLPNAPDPFWTGAYISICSLMFLGCLFHAIKLGIWEYHNADRRDPWLTKVSASLTQLFALVFFATAYWALESYASFNSPYYVYSQFPGAIPQLFYLLGYTPEATDMACPALVNKLKALGPTYNTIPLAVLMMESSITYVGMWTALQLRARYYLLPVFAGLISLNVDVLMDPIVSVVYDCNGAILRGGDGLAFWHWYSGGADHLGTWYGVPLFNFAAWWAAPAGFVCIVLVAQYFRNRLWRARRKRDPINSAPVASQAAALSMVLALVGVFYVINLFRPAGTVPVAVTWAVMGAVLAGSILWIALERHRFTTQGRADPWLTHPPLAFIAIALVGLLLNGIFMDLPTLLPVALAALVLGLLLVLWPYQDTVCAIAQRVVDLDRYVRLHYLGFTSMLVLLGGFSTALQRSPEGVAHAGLSPWLIGGLLAIGTCFHVYAYVLNDVIDLGVDRTQDKRQRDPLVRGAVSWSSALALALLQIPTALLVLWLLAAPVPAYLTLLAGFALMTAYNWWGKVCPFPPLTDLVQALAWGSLVWLGAFTAEPSTGTTGWPFVWSAFILGSGFILLINGIHGGLRDLRNDVAQGQRTTAVLLGARWDEGAGHVVSTGKVAAFAFGVHTLMFALPFGVLLPDSAGLATIAVLATFLLSNFYLWHTVKPIETDPARDAWLQRHIFIVLLAPVVGFLPFLDLTAAMVLLVAFFAPLLAMENIVEALVRFTHPAIAAQVVVPPGQRLVEPEDRTAQGAVVDFRGSRAATGEKR